MKRLKRFGEVLWGLPRGHRKRQVLDAYLAELRRQMIGDLERDLTAGLDSEPDRARWVKMKRRVTGAVDARRDWVLERPYSGRAKAS